MIMNMAEFFPCHVFWPHGFTGCFDGVVTLICVLASLALFRYKICVIPVIGLCGLAGRLCYVSIATSL